MHVRRGRALLAGGARSTSRGSVIPACDNQARASGGPAMATQELNPGKRQGGEGVVAVHSADELFAFLVLDGAAKPLDTEARREAKEIRRLNPGWVSGVSRRLRLS